MIRSDGTRPPGALLRRWIRGRLALRRWLQPTVVLEEHGHRSRFVCESYQDAFRATSLWVKEPGTMAWIEAEVRAGDVFFDIGANVGIYTIAAAHRVGDAGKVVAFEPHKVNAQALLRNIAASGLDARIEVIASAVSETPGLARFHYKSLKSASSASQLGHRRNATRPGEFEPVVTELVPAVSIDALVAGGDLPRPDLVKIDVDGNEIDILRGMRGVLGDASRRPRAVQVEINPGEAASVTAFMEDCGYAPAERHFTRKGAKELERGRAPDDIAYNAIFRPTDIAT